MSKILCPRGCGNEARTHALFGVMPCLKCVGQDRTKRQATKSPEFYAQTMQTRIQGQRDRHEGDIIPPYTHEGKPNEDYRRAFPEKAKELFSEYERVTGNKTELSK